MAKKWKERVNEFTNSTLESTNRCMILSMVMGMFDYSEDMLSYFRKEFLERGFLNYGSAAILKKDGKYYAGYWSNVEFDDYGLPTGTADFFTQYRYIASGEIGKDIVIGWNNDIRTPELIFDKFASYLAECDRSIRTAIMNSRLTNNPVACDENEKKAIDIVLETVYDGKPKTVVQSNLLNKFMQDNGSNEIRTLKLTDPDYVRNIQYLSNLHDDLLKRICIIYGHSLNGVNKMAQVNSDELKGYETLARVYPLIMFDERKKFINECNRVFGTNWEVHFSDAWKHILSENGVEVTDTEETDVTETEETEVEENVSENIE